MSRKAIVRALLDTIVAGTSAAAMPQNKHSDTLEILTCAGSGTPPTYMVALLRTTMHHPSDATGPASFWLSVAQGESCAGAGARHEMGVGEVQVARRAGRTTPREDP